MQSPATRRASIGVLLVFLVIAAGSMIGWSGGMRVQDSGPFMLKASVISKALGAVNAKPILRGYETGGTTAS